MSSVHRPTKEKSQDICVPSLAPENNVKQSIAPAKLIQENRHGSMPAAQRTDAPTTTKREIWSWYMYYIGANGIGPFNFAPVAFQNLLSQASVDSKLHFAGRERDVNSVVLLCNGVSFALQAVLFLVLGAYADYGTCRRWILLIWSSISYGVGFGWIGVHGAETWQVAVALYILGLVSYQTTTTYWVAAFPSLARNTQHLKDCRASYERGDISQQDLYRHDEMERSRLSNVAFWAQSVVEIFILAIIVGIVFAVRGSDGMTDNDTANNNWCLSIVITFATAYWLVFSVPWFVFEKNRPGLDVPPGRDRITAGFVLLSTAVSQIWRLKQSLIFLAGYFLLGDSLNTTITVISTLQNQVVEYNTLMLVYLLAVNIAAQAAGIGVYWWVQKTLKISVKSLFNVIIMSIILLDAWGMVGNWTSRFGFHNVWEIWAYQVFYGLLICPWYSYAQIMISSVTPRGHESLFFSIFNIIGKASSLIGPLVSSAIIDATPGSSNNNAPFYFLFALSVVSAIEIWLFLDLEKSAQEQGDFLEMERARVYRVGTTGCDGTEGGMSLDRPDLTLPGEHY
ncbi:hypothetical protein QQS21_003913 [Conoideocrella luteorostrata]|uniref:Autophagy-related protein n=1 Tax=Conoideocrella luteorostrata TaxID=1105319 RepID=A0AAJ0CSH3_9HYPO|nr:hypothetical protein QQS21_003913 [Conoideocrella luteorostrata]